MIKHQSPISGIATHGGRYVLTAGYDNQVILWRADDRRSIARGAHDHLVNQCAFSPDGRLAATSGSDYLTRIWRVPDLRLQAVCFGHDDDVEGIAFHPHKPLIATCSRDHTVRLFSLDGAQQRCLRGHQADVISVAWEGAGDILLSSSDDGTIRRWNTASGELIETIDLGGVETDTVAVGRDHMIYAGNDEGCIACISGVAGQGVETRQIEAHEAGIKRLIHDQTQNRLVSLSYDRRMKVWQCDGAEIHCIHTAELPQIIWPRSAAFLDQNRLVFVTFGSAYGEYHIGRRQWALEHIEDTAGINAVCQVGEDVFTVGDAGVVRRNGEVITRLPSLCNFLEPCGERIITGGQSGEVFDALSGERLHQHRSPINCAATFRRDGRRHLLLGTYTGDAPLLREDDRGELVLETVLQLHENAIKGLAAGSDGILSVCADNAARIIAIDTLESRFYDAHAHDKIANGCAAGGDGLFASVSRDLKLRLWRGDRPEVIDSPHENSIKCVAMSADGEWIATGSYTGYVAVYSVSQRQWVLRYRPTAAGISSLCRQSQDQGFIASSYDGQIHTLHPERYRQTQVKVA